MNEPIDEMEYLSGLKVVDIGDLRVSRGRTRRPRSACRHIRITYDPTERRIWCRDCETDVDPFDVFVLFAERAHSHKTAMDRREKQIAEAEAFTLRSRAAKAIDEAWRKRNMVPACPHCHNGLFPEHFKAGMTMLGRDYALARISKKT